MVKPTVQGTGVIKIIGINPYVLIAPREAARLRPGWRRRLPVRVRVNGGRQNWPINLMPVGDGTFYLYLSGAIRKATVTCVGDQITYEIWFDESYAGGPQHDLPTAFAAALAADSAAQARYDALPPSRQKEITHYFAGLKSSGAIERNIQKALAALSGQPTRWLGRDWNGGTP